MSDQVQVRASLKLLSDELDGETLPDGQAVVAFICTDDDARKLGSFLFDEGLLVTVESTP